MTFRRQLLIFSSLGLVSVATVLFGATTVLADSSEGVTQPSLDAPLQEIVDRLEMTELEDLQFFADQQHMSLETAIIEYSWRHDFASVVQTIQERFPDTFAGADIGGVADIRMSFAGPIPDEAMAIVEAFEHDFRGLGLSTDVRSDSVLTERELVEAIEDIHFAVLDAPGVLDASTSYDMALERLAVTVLLQGDESAGKVEDLQILAQRAAEESLGPGLRQAMDIEVAQSPSPLGRVHSSSHHRGGEILSMCTSGFGTKTPAGVRGISTAGHCSNSQSDDGSALTFRGQHIGTHGDFQWHTGPKTHSNGFYSGSSTSTEVNLRYVSSVGLPVAGLPLCRNGATSKKDCQEVRRIHVCQGSVCNLVQMGAKLSSGGDSGGPYYWGNAAYGLHRGEMYDPWPFDRDIFSRADRIDNALGTYIATN